MNDLLQIKGLSKSFSGVQALGGVDFSLQAGEIHALMGENGAGKSTLIKVLNGVYPRDSGTVHLSGQPVLARSPAEAEALGISTVFQEVNLIPKLSVAENIVLGRQESRLGLINWRRVHERAEKALSRLGLDSIDLSRSVGSYSMAIQQLISLARALDVEASILILDEPTSSLDEQEVKQLFDVMRRLRAEGLGLIFVTHFLDQVYAISDRITVLRSGRLVGEYRTDDLDRLELIAAMLGKDLADIQRTSGEKASSVAPAREDTPVLRVRGLERKGSLAPFDVDVHSGEIIGFAGLLGSGRTETVRLFFGVDKPSGGVIEVAGKPASLSSPSKAIRHGFAFCSEDRRGEGLIPTLSVRENIILAIQARRGACRLLSRQKQNEIAEQFIASLNIKAPSPETPIENLSGGNQQKVLLARWLCMKPDLLILDEPTRGIDVGAKAEIVKLLGALREKGMAIILISSELEEVVQACDRVSVCRDGRKIGELSGKEVSQDRIMSMIAAEHKLELSPPLD